MLIRFFEQIINNCRIPSFILAQGEILIIQLPEGPLFHELKLQIAKVLTGNIVNDQVKISTPLSFVEHFKESAFRRHFFPTSINSYHNKYANKANPVYKKIYEIPWMTPQIKVQSLAGTPRRKLCIYTTLSYTNNIIFDLVAVDPKGGQEIFGFVKTIVNGGGAAILLDHCDEFKNDCTKFIKAEYIGSNA